MKIKSPNLNRVSKLSDEACPGTARANKRLHVRPETPTEGFEADCSMPFCRLSGTCWMELGNKPRFDLRPPNKLIVDSEYGSSGLCVMIDGRFRMIELDDLDLPPSLCDQFNDWGEMLYELRLSPDLLNDYIAAGRKVARALKAFVGPNVIVDYYGSYPHEIIE